MSLWVTVATAYVVIIALGLALGSLLAGRFPRRNGGGGSGPPVPTPYGGPSYGLEDLPALGSEFDRRFLPGAFRSELLPR